MKELDLLKKDWQKQNVDAARFSYQEIYNMLLKKSSSVVRWIFIVSLVEFVIWHLLYLLPNNLELYAQLDMMWLIYTTSSIHYLVTFGFIYYFYQNFKRIRTTDKIKNLMERIIKTRKTVKYYVVYNLGAFALVYSIIIIMMYAKKDLLFKLDLFKEQMELLPEFKSLFFVMQAISAVFVILIFGGIYFLLYGVMLRKLKKNYQELAEIEQ